MVLRFARMKPDRLRDRARHGVVFRPWRTRICWRVAGCYRLQPDMRHGKAARMFTPRAPNPGLAALLTLLAAALLAGTTLLAKALGTDTLGPPLHALQVSHGRFLFAFLAIAVTVGLVRPVFTRPDLITHVKRSGLGWGGVTLMFAAAAFIPL